MEFNMERFKSHYMRLDEMATQLLKDLDRDYIRKAMAIKSINIKAKDFGSIKYKKVIQYMIAQHWFPKFPLELIQEKLTTSSKNTVNKSIKYLRDNYYNTFMQLWNFPAAGIGPGEAMIYFLVNKAIVGGGGSAGIDIMILDGDKYELKAATISKDRIAAGFRLGGTVKVSDMVREVVQFKKDLGLKFGGTGEEEVNKADLIEIRKKYPTQMRKIESDFVNKAYGYLAKNKLLLFNNNKVSGTAKDEDARGNLKRDVGGNIEFIGTIKKNQVRLGQITQGKPKPEVKL